MASIGDAYIDVHANTLPFDRELDRNLELAAKDAEASLEKTGTKFGDTISKSTSKEIGRRGRDFGGAIEKATKNVVVQIRSKVKFDRIRDAIRRTFRRDVGDSIEREIGDAFDRSARSGGPISKLSQAFADAIGAGFNVSGRSPLIAILLPALLALLGVILAAVQAVNALVAVLFIVPGLIASIGLQAGVIAIAFQGMGEAIQGAFAAKNAKELREALKGLTPSARGFVKELLPLRKLFQDLQKTVQEKFFSQLTGVITNLRRALGPSLIQGFGAVAVAAGQFFRDFGNLLASRGFVRFFNSLIPATVRWLDKLAGSLFGKRGFVTALLSMATALMPFMEKFGDIVLRNLDHISGLMFQLASSPATQVWLDRMADTLQLVFDLLFKVGEFLFVFMAQLDAAGGQELFRVLMESLQELMFVLSSPVGLKAMEGLVNLAIFGIRSFTGLIVVILAVFAAFQVFAEWLKDVFGPQWLKTMRTIGQGIVNAATFLGVWIERIIRFLGGFFASVGRVISGAVGSFVRAITSLVVKIIDFINRLRGIPGQVTAVFKNFGSLLVNAGRNLIQGLINGVNQKINALRSVISQIAGIIGGFFGSSPAKEGPLSGRGWTLHRGERMMQDLIKGIEMETPDLRQATMNATSNIIFGRDSIQMSFQGPTPDQSQARTVGSAMGMSAANMIASRNTKLAVRTL